jgi:amphi-Trp domain-containing protein
MSALAVGLGGGDFMAGPQESKPFCTLRKDEAAFYLNELAKGLLRNRISVPLRGSSRLMAPFESIQLEITVAEGEGRCQVQIQLSWAKSMPPATIGAGDDDLRGELQKAS